MAALRCNCLLTNPGLPYMMQPATARKSIATWREYCRACRCGHADGTLLPDAHAHADANAGAQRLAACPAAARCDLRGGELLMSMARELSPVIVGVIIAVLVLVVVVALWRATSGPGKVVMSADRIQMMKEAVGRAHPPTMGRPMGMR